MKRYPEYKDSGVEWIGEIPIGWKVIKFKFVTTLMTCGHAATPEYVDSYVGMPFLSAQNIKNQKIDLFTFNYITKELFDSLTKNHKPEKGDLLQVRVGGASTIGETAVIESDFDFTIYVSLAHIKLNKLALNYYIKNLCNSDAFKKYSSIIMKKGAGVANLNVSDLEKYRIPLPPINEQSQIATFLDLKTSMIDDLIAKKQNLIELLKEERTALINHAVTKGLDPTVPMKDSGIDWLGETPEHWVCNKLKSLGLIRYGLGQPPKSMENGLPLIRATNIQRGEIVINDMLYVNPDELPMGKNPILKKGEIIIVRSGAYTGDSAIITSEYEGAVAGYDMVFTPVNSYPEFISFCFLSNYVLRNQLIPASSRAAQPHLNAEELGSTIIACPPYKEQVILSTYLKNKQEKFEATVIKIRKEIELISEYKTSLINEAITGKINISDAN